jgi:hypothetical protein
MNPLERLLDVELRLSSGAISVDQARAELSAGPKHWQTPWWKTQRKRRLGTSCSTCGSASPPLVLQHKWQPVSWPEALRRVGPPNWQWWNERHPLPTVDRPHVPFINRQVCPICGSVRIYFRKKAKDWVCEAGQGGAPDERHPDFRFPEPAVAQRPDTMGIRRRNQVARREYQRLSDTRWNAWLQSPERAENQVKALRLRIEESKRYLSFSDTTTLCRRCAAREDHRYILRTQRYAAERKQAELFAEFDSIE